MFVFCKILIISHFSSWLRFQRLCCRLRGYQFHFVVTIRVQMLLTLPAYVLVLTSNMGSPSVGGGVALPQKKKYVWKGAFWRILSKLVRILPWCNSLRFWCSHTATNLFYYESWLTCTFIWNFPVKCPVSLLAGEQSTESLTTRSTTSDNVLSSDAAETVPVTVTTSDTVTSSTDGHSDVVSTSDQLLTSDMSSSLIQSVTTRNEATTTDLSTTVAETTTTVSSKPL